MSKVKSPAEKKALSLKLDRRNVYGESPHASRKNIPRGKRRAHKNERHAVGQILGNVGTEPDEDAAIAAELAAKLAARAVKLKGFKKGADWPLGRILAWSRFSIDYADESTQSESAGKVIEAVLRGSRWRLLKKGGRS
jgi:hypothetical protein